MDHTNGLFIFSKRLLLYYYSTLTDKQQKEFLGFLKFRSPKNAGRFQRLHKLLKELNRQFFTKEPCDSSTIDQIVQVFERPKLLPLVRGIDRAFWQIVRNQIFEDQRDQPAGEKIHVLKVALKKFPQSQHFDGFSKEDMLFLLDSLESPDHFDYMLSISSRGTTNLLKKFIPKNLFNHLVPKGTYSRNKLNKIIAEFIVHLEDYLAFSTLQSDPLQKADYLNKALSATPDTEIQQCVLDNWEKTLAKKRAGHEKSESLCKLLHARYQLSGKQNNRANSPFLSELISQRSRHRLLEDLPQAINYLIRQQVYDEEYDRKFVEDKLHAARLPGQQEDLLISIFVDILELWSQENVVSISQFQKIRAYIESCQKKIASADLEIINNFLRTYCISSYHKSRTGTDRWLSEQAHLYRWSIDQDFLFQAQSSIQGWILVNIVVTFSLLKDFTYAEEVLTKYLPLVPNNYQTDIYNLSMGYIYFHRKHFVIAKSHLSHITRRENHFAIRKYSLILRLHLELYLKDANPESLEKSLMAFGIFLQRNSYKMSVEKREQYTNLHYFVKELFRNLDAGRLSAETSRVLLTELKEKPTPAKSWIREKIQLLAH